MVYTSRGSFPCAGSKGIACKQPPIGGGEGSFSSSVNGGSVS